MLDITQARYDALGKSLANEYYEDQIKAGTHRLMDRMRTKGWGTFSGAFVDWLENGHWNDYRLKFKSKFELPFTQKLKLALHEYFGYNQNDIAKRAFSWGVNELRIATSLPIPLVGKPIKTKLINVGAGAIDSALHKRSIAEADRVVDRRTDDDVEIPFNNDRDAMAAAQNAMKRYKEIAGLIDSLPEDVTTLEDAVLYPYVAAKVRMAASDLQVSLYRINKYLEGMRLRAELIAQSTPMDVEQLSRQMADIAKAAAANAYQSAVTNARQSAQRTAPAAQHAYFRRPILMPAGVGEGGATQLANLIAYALALGAYDTHKIDTPQLGRFNENDFGRYLDNSFGSERRRGG